MKGPCARELLDLRIAFMNKAKEDGKFAFPKVTLTRLMGPFSKRNHKFKHFWTLGPYSKKDLEDQRTPKILRFLTFYESFSSPEPGDYLCLCYAVMHSIYDVV